jgi:hypothetical protein
MRTTATTLVAACALLAACSDSTAPGSGADKRLSLSFAVPAPTGASAGVTVGGVAAGAQATGPLVVTRAQLVLRELELALATGDRCDDDSHGSDSGSGSRDDGCPEIEFEPFLLDLPVSGGVVSPISVDVPAGSYHELEMKIHVPRLGSDDPEDVAFLAAHPELRGVSVRVEGTYEGEPFVFTSDVSAKLEMEFRPALVVDASGLNVTIAIDLHQWFRTAGGAWIDPRSAMAGGPNEATVDANIRGSFHAFEDDDHDGGDDHGGHGGDDGPGDDHGGDN